MQSHDPHTDDELICLLRVDDQSALAEIYQRHWEHLYISAYALLADRTACEDIIQNIFLNIWLMRDKLAIHKSLKSYLYGAMRNEVFRVIRSNKVREELFQNLEHRLYTDSDSNILEQKEALEYVNMIVNQLPERCRMVYKLSREEGLSHRQIADVMKISTKTVENQMTKALSHIRAGLELFLLLFFLPR